MPSTKKIKISSPQKKPEVSVVLCVYNEENYLDTCLESMKEQSFQDFEVVLVDDGSKDRTLDIADKYDLRIVKQDHLGLGAARNNGAKNSKGKIIAFLDADMTFDKHYLKELIKPIQDGGTHGTTHGKEYAKNLDNIWARCWGRIRVDPSIESRKPHNYRAILKKVFERSGGFESSWGYADDQSLTAKVGYATLAHDALCYHNNPASLKETYLQARWIGGSYSKKILYFLLVGIIGFIALLFVGTSFIGTLGMNFVFLILLGVALYILFVLYMTLRTAKREKNWTLLYLYPMFITVRVVASMHGLLRKVTGKYFLQ